MHRATKPAGTLLAAAALLGAACAKQGNGGPAEKPTRAVGSVIVPPPPATESLSATVQDTNVADQARLTQLEREARALVKTDGCSTVSACRTAPVGWRGCGGPRSYLVYCAATTDTAALFRKLAELERAEKAYNAKSGMMSTCEMRLPPTATLQGGSCTEARARR